MKSRLQDSVLFSDISAAESKLIEAIGRRHEIEKGAFLFFQDDPAERFFIVLSGRIKIAKIAADGKEQILLLAGPGDSFGEAALFAGTSYPAGAEAVADSSLMSFGRDDFMNLLASHPRLAINMIARLSTLLHHLAHLIQQLSLENITTRLAGHILELLPEKARSVRPQITLKEKKKVLASLLGTVPETLSRALARLTRQGIIAVRGQKITVLDLPRLKESAAGKNFNS